MANNFPEERKRVLRPFLSLRHHTSVARLPLVQFGEYVPEAPEPGLEEIN
ncbi:MAG: hypothetical protein ABW185_26260 [Sedimenticola sp.]